MCCYLLTCVKINDAAIAAAAGDADDDDDKYKNR